jgi:hypothetical protein
LHESLPLFNFIPLYAGHFHGVCMTKSESVYYALAATAILLALFFSKDAAADLIVASSDSYTTYDNLFKKYGEKYRLNWRWIKALAWNESNIGRATSVKNGIADPSDVENSASSDGLSWGIMQTTILTSRDYLPKVTVADLNNPETSIMLGAVHFARLMGVFQNDIRKAVMAYNNGEGNVKKGSLVSLPYFEKFQTHLDAINSRQP